MNALKTEWREQIKLLCFYFILYSWNDRFEQKGLSMSKQPPFCCYVWLGSSLPLTWVMNKWDETRCCLCHAVWSPPLMQGTVKVELLIGADGQTGGRKTSSSNEKIKQAVREVERGSLRCAVKKYVPSLGAEMRKVVMVAQMSRNHSWWLPPSLVNQKFLLLKSSWTTWWHICNL